jgi:hypothetical protein
MIKISNSISHPLIFNLKEYLLKLTKELSINMTVKNAVERDSYGKL